mgnify:CR=1 FL=1
MAQKYPKVLYAFYDNEDTSDECLLCFENPADFANPNEDRFVGVYEFKYVATVSAEVKVREL